MEQDPWAWVDNEAKRQEEVRSDAYFTIEEGDNRIQLLTHCAPFPQVWMQSEKKYRPAVDGDTGVSIRGVCWVLQDGKIKEAKLPYTVVKAVRELMQDQDWAFEEFPMPRQINIRAKNAGTKEVEYSVIPSPKEVSVSKDVLEELAKKPTPEERVERMKGKAPLAANEEDTKPEDISFD